MVHNPVLKGVEGAEAATSSSLPVESVEKLAKESKERYGRPEPTPEELKEARFHVRVVGYSNEHEAVEATQLRPVWVWKYRAPRKGNKEGEGDDADDADDADAVDAGGKRVDKRLGAWAEGAEFFGTWGRSRGREMAGKLQKSSKHPGGDTAEGATKAQKYACEFRVGDKVEVRQLAEIEYLGSRYGATVLDLDASVRKAKVEYLEFDDEEKGEGVKLMDWVDMYQLRPLPPSQPRFGRAAYFKKLSKGSALELLHEDGQWDVELVAIIDAAGRQPPPHVPTAFGVGRKEPGEDGKMWEVKAGRGGDSWFPVDDPKWAPPKVGDEGASYKVKLVPSNEVVSLDSLDALRPCWVWDRWTREWDTAATRRDAKAFYKHEEDEEVRLAEAREKKRTENPPSKASDEEVSHALLGEFAIGDRVEITQVEEGMVGSWYAATVRELQAPAGEVAKALVEFDELLEEGGNSALLKEWVPLPRVRPLPPSASGFSAFLDELQVGDPLEYHHSDGWWVVVLVAKSKGAKGAPRFTVKYMLTPETAVDASALRPFWCWQKGAEWLQGKSCWTDVSGGLYPNAPPFAPELFASGTLRLGVDGFLYVRANDAVSGHVWMPASFFDAPDATSHGPGKELVGKTIEVHWPLDQAWYVAKVTAYKAASSKHMVHYLDDDVKEALALGTEEWRLFEGDEATLPQPPSGVKMPKREAKQPRSAPGTWGKVSASMLVEASPLDDKYSGSWYFAVVVAVVEQGKSMHVRVRFLSLHGVGGVELEEVLPAGFVRQPPPAPPANWLEHLPDGATVGIRYKDGWWDATMKSRKATASARRGATKFFVEPAPSSALPAISERAVGADEMRPCWAWSSKRWRLAHDPNFRLGPINEDTMSVEAQEAAGLRADMDAMREQAVVKAAAKAATSEAGAGGASGSRKRPLAPGSQVASGADGASDAVGGKRQRVGSFSQRGSSGPCPVGDAGVTTKSQEESTTTPPPLEVMDSIAGGEGEDEMPDGLEVGSRVEIEHEDEAGSWYAAQVVATKPGAAKITYSTLDADEEWFDAAKLRPAPPRPPAGWAESLCANDRVELLNEGAWWEVVILEINRARISQEAFYLVRSSYYGDEHEVAAALLRPKWFWLSARQQWQAAHNGELFSRTSTVALPAQAQAVELVKTQFTLNAPRDLKPDETLKFKAADDGKVYRCQFSVEVKQGAPIRISVSRPPPKPLDQVFVSMPPNVAGGEKFVAILTDGRELVVTAPEGLSVGQQMLVPVPVIDKEQAAKEAAEKEEEERRDKQRQIEEREDAVKAVGPLATMHLGGADAGRKGRQQVYGIAYRQFEQYIIARYGACANGRLMGSLAAAVRAGRLHREGKLYIPTGSMLSPLVLSELAKLSEAQRTAAIAEEKRNKKLAKQLALTGACAHFPPTIWPTVTDRHAGSFMPRRITHLIGVPPCARRQGTSAAGVGTGSAVAQPEGQAGRPGC